ERGARRVTSRSKRPGYKGRRQERGRGLELLAERTEELARKGFQEVATPDADQQGGAKKQDGVKAGPAFAGPIDLVFEVEPKGELIQSESGPDSVKQGHEAAGEKRRTLCSGTHLQQQHETQ